MFNLHKMLWHTIRVQMDYQWNLSVKVLMKVRVRTVSLTFHFWTDTHFVPCVWHPFIFNATFWVFSGCLLSKTGRERDQPWKFSVCTVLMYELRMCPRSFFGTILFVAWEKIFHLDYQQRYFVWSPATFYIMTIIKLLNTIRALAVFLQVSKSDLYK
jgi:hypothetical protein